MNLHSKLLFLLSGTAAGAQNAAAFAFAGGCLDLCPGRNQAAQACRSLSGVGWMMGDMLLPGLVDLRRLHADAMGGIEFARSHRCEQVLFLYLLYP